MSEQKDLTYSKAFEELQSIVSEIENESVDVDILTSKIKRATELIKFCKSKLKSTEGEVKKVLSEIEEESEEEPSDTEFENF
ncbi:MAG: exodeoxyribonuclease VII small subunit [Nitrospirae bacterium]|nr:exodeoxyribonuclease VII small subunit [Nitrospirota bacterium]